MDEEYEYQFKIVLAGDSGVGKSCFLQQYVFDRFSEEHEITVAVEFESKMIELHDGILIQNQLWDTAGGEQYRSISKTFFKKQTIIMQSSSAAALLFYDITRKDSFNNIPFWYDQLKGHSPKIQIILIGTHKDLTAQRQVSEQDAKNLALEMNFSKSIELDLHDKDQIDITVNSISYNILRMIQSKIINPKQSVYGIKSKHQDSEEEITSPQSLRQSQQASVLRQTFSPLAEDNLDEQKSEIKGTSPRGQQSENQQENQQVKQIQLQAWVYVIPIIFAIVFYYLNGFL